MHLFFIISALIILSTIYNLANYVNYNKKIRNPPANKTNEMSS